MPPKKTYDYFLERYEPLNITIELTREEYGKGDIMKYKCSEGHVVEIKVSTASTRFTDSKKKNIPYCSVCSKNNRSNNTLDRYKQACIERGFEFISADVPNRKVTYKCNCGNIKTHFSSTLERNINGTCHQCSQISNRLKIEDISKVFSDEKCILLEDNYTNNKQKLKYLCSCGVESFIILSDFKAGKRCKQCMIKRTKLTNIEKYGHENTFQVLEFKIKMQITNIENLGVPYPMMNPEILKMAQDTCERNNGYRCIFTTPENRELIRKCCREKWGTDYPLQSEKFWEHIRSLNMERFGVDHHAKTESWKESMKKHFLDNYGSDTYINSEEGKALMLYNYGAETAMHVYEFYRKAAKSMYSSKDYTLPSGKVIKVMGYEWICLDVLFGKKIVSRYDYVPISEDDITVEILPIPYQDNTGKRRMYYPDIYIKDKLMIEVKCIYTFNNEYARNHCKFKQAAKFGPFQVWLFSSKKQLIEIISYFKDGSAIFSDGREYKGNKIKDAKISPSEDDIERKNYDIFVSEILEDL